jgi:hypothetical protein
MGGGIPVNSRKISNNIICAIVGNSVLDENPGPVRDVSFERYL